MKEFDMCVLKTLYLLVGLVVLTQGHQHFKRIERSRIAIIGGGIGGTTVAYELTQLAEKYGYNIQVNLYEPEKIGGHLATTFVNGHEFETGGSIIHVTNKHMVAYVKRFNLNWYHEPTGYEKREIVGFYNGERFVLIQSDFQLWNVIRKLWRYGYDLVLKIDDRVMNPLIAHFQRIYLAQKNGETFDDVKSMLKYMFQFFPHMMTIEFKNYLRAHGFSDRYIDEVVYIATNVNYNQNTDIPTFVGFMCLAGTDENNLVRVEGGNRLVPEALLNASDATLISSRVESIYLTPDYKYALQADNCSQIYDYVVVACPIIENSKNKLKFEGFPYLNIPKINYQLTVATLVHGELNHTFFKYSSPKDLPNKIFSTNQDLFFNSISVLDPVIFDENYDRKVFKVMSKKVLTNEELDLLFLKHDSVTVKPWLAYPLYDTKARDMSFVLHDNLFYVNAIEWAASAMEMSAVSGVNAALKIKKLLEKEHSKYDLIFDEIVDSILEEF